MIRSCFSTHVFFFYLHRLSGTKAYCLGGVPACAFFHARYATTGRIVVHYTTSCGIDVSPDDAAVHLFLRASDSISVCLPVRSYPFSVLHFLDPSYSLSLSLTHSLTHSLFLFLSPVSLFLFLVLFLAFALSFVSDCRPRLSSDLIRLLPRGFQAIMKERDAARMKIAALEHTPSKEVVPVVFAFDSVDLALVIQVRPALSVCCVSVCFIRRTSLLQTMRASSLHTNGPPESSLASAADMLIK
jgi:hypothetical protein